MFIFSFIGVCTNLENRICKPRHLSVQDIILILFCQSKNCSFCDVDIRFHYFVYLIIFLLLVQPLMEAQTAQK